MPTMAKNAPANGKVNTIAKAACSARLKSKNLIINENTSEAIASAMRPADSAICSAEGLAAISAEWATKPATNAKPQNGLKPNI